VSISKSISLLLLVLQAANQDLLFMILMQKMSQVGGPSYAVKLGRRDSTTASRTLANAELPAFFESLESLISRFQKKGLTARDMVALSGSHTLGQAQCFTFRERIYNHSNIDAGFASTRRRRCPRVGSDATLAPLDLVTPNSFDNNYFKNLMQNSNGGSTDSIVSEYSRNPARFKSDFGSAMIKMGDIGLLTGSAGQIRRICSGVNN
jgi:peroxidase